MAGGKSTPATQTSTQNTTSDPWAPLVPHLTDLMTRGQTALNATPNTTATTYAGPNQMQRDAASMIAAQAPGLATGANELRQLGLDTVGGKYLDPSTNPWLSKTVQQGIDQNTRNLTQTVLPGMADAAILGGAYGGSGYGVAQGIAAGENQRVNADAATQAYAQNYQLERERQLNSGQLFNQANTLSLLPGQTLDLVGTQQQGWDQDLLDANANAPWAGLDRYQQLLGSASGYGTTSGTTTGTQTAAKGSKGAGLLQGAMGGASAGSAFGPWGAGIGGVLGGLGGLFG